MIKSALERPQQIGLLLSTFLLVLVRDEDLGQSPCDSLVRGVEGWELFHHDLIGESNQLKELKPQIPDQKVRISDISCQRRTAAPHEVMMAQGWMPHKDVVNVGVVEFGRRQPLREQFRL